MGSRPARHRYCRCGTHLAADNTERQCARCQRAARDKLIAPPQVPAEFWQTEQLREAFTAQHIGRVARAYRMHPHHHAVYGPSGISQTLLGQWLGLRQPQVSRIETGPPTRDLDTLAYWARVLRIPAELLWFDLPGQTRRAALRPARGIKTLEGVSLAGRAEGHGHAAAEPTGSYPTSSSSRGVLEAPTEIVARRAELQISGLTGELVAELEQFLADLPDRYEVSGPLDLAPEVVDARRLVHQLLAGNQQLKQRARLFELAGNLSGQLSYMAVNLGDFSTAQAHGGEAFELAQWQHLSTVADFLDDVSRWLAIRWYGGAVS